MAISKVNLIKKDLIDQLESQSKFGKYYTDMVDDYIYFYELKTQLKKDIKDRGIRYKTTNGNGMEVEKPNESIKNLTMINTQMLKILTDLGLKEPLEPDPGDDDDLL